MNFAYDFGKECVRMKISGVAGSRYMWIADAKITYILLRKEFFYEKICYVCIALAIAKLDTILCT